MSLEIGRRILELRKKLKLNQTDFGKRIGVTRSAVCNYENGSRSIGEQVILAICREFGVDEFWLRTGEGEMFRQENQDIVERLTMEYKLTKQEQSLITSFLKLSSNERAAIMQYVANLVESFAMPSDREGEFDINSIDTVMSESGTTITQNLDTESRLAALKRENEYFRQQNEEMRKEIEAIREEDAMRKDKDLKYNLSMLYEQ